MADKQTPIGDSLAAFGQKNIRCLLELVALNLNFKPVILAVIDIIETYLTSMMASFQIQLDKDQIMFGVLEMRFNAVEALFQAGTTQLNNLTSLANSAARCSSLDEVISFTRLNLEAKVITPYNKIKEKYIRAKRKISSLSLQLSAIEDTKKFFQLLRDLVDKIPETLPTDYSASPEDTFRGV